MGFALLREPYDGEFLRIATREIPGMIETIRVLIERGMAYARAGAVYFRAARFAGYVAIYPFAGARDETNARRLDAALKEGDMASVRSLRREPHAEDETCWLHGEGWCLSRREPDGA